MAVGDDQKNQVQQATDIVRLVGEDTRLQPRGKEFVGLCPFHDDSSPSMYVSPAKQIFKCFACGAGGDVFSWMTRYHKMTFPEALKHLAERAGIPLRTFARPEGEGPSDRQLILEANGKALEFYQRMLRDPGVGRIAHDYVQQRGINAAMAEAFQLGYAPDQWDALTRAMSTNHWNPKGFRLAGLVAARGQGEGEYDRLRHRLIFPICDALGKPIAFGGRVLAGGTIGDKSDAKYLNSPESAVFNKSATLYGLHLAKKAIIDSHTAVIVEGYTDVIACHQAGQKNVVATLGTAFTAQHARELGKYAERVVLIFDADEAGQKAADRAVEVFFAGTLDVGVAVLPEGLDPADLLGRADGLAVWQQAVAGATDALGYQFGRLRQRFEAADTMAGRLRITEDYLRQLAHMGLAKQGAIRRAMVIQKLAELLHPISEREIAGMLKRLETPVRGAPVGSRQGGAGPGEAKTQAAEGGDRTDLADFDEKSGFSDVAVWDDGPKIKALGMAERHLIGGLLRQPGLFHEAVAGGRTLDEAVTPEEMVSDAGRRLYAVMYPRLCDGETLTLASLLAELASQGEQGLCDWATAAEAEVEHLVADVDEKLMELASAAADALLAHQRETAYQRVRASNDSAASQEDQLLRKVFEYQRSHPSAKRIARIGS